MSNPRLFCCHIRLNLVDRPRHDQVQQRRGPVERCEETNPFKTETVLDL